LLATVILCALALLIHHADTTAGWLVEGSGGWFYFFWLCFFLAFPGMLLLFKVAPWNGDQPKEREEAALAKRGVP
jgi:hypothetical protein